MTIEESTPGSSAITLNEVLTDGQMLTRFGRSRSVCRLSGLKHRPGGRLHHPALQRTGPGFVRAEMGFELGDGAHFPFAGLFQKRQSLIGTKRSRLAIQRRNRAILAYVFQNCFPAHGPSPLELIEGDFGRDGFSIAYPLK